MKRLTFFLGLLLVAGLVSGQFRERYPLEVILEKDAPEVGDACSLARHGIQLVKETGVMWDCNRTTATWSKLAIDISDAQLDAIYAKDHPFVDLEHTSYGIACDGSTDDTTALNAAIAAGDGKVIRFGLNKTCMITEAIDLDGHTGTIIDGNGSTLKWIDATADPASGTSRDGSVLTIRNSSSNVTVTNLTLDGNWTNRTPTQNADGTALFIEQSTDVLIDNVTINDAMLDGIWISGQAGTPNNKRIRVQNSHITGSRRNGISVTDGESVHLVGNRIENTGKPAAGSHDGATLAYLSDSTASFTVDALIGCALSNTSNGESTTITDNDATTATGTLSGGESWDNGDRYKITCGTSPQGGIDIEYGNTWVAKEGTFVRGNHITLSGTYGVNVSTTAALVVDSVVVDGNVIRDSLTNGIQLSTLSTGGGLTDPNPSAGIVVAGNSIRNPIGNGIQCTRHCADMISGNTVTGFGGAGLQASVAFNVTFAGNYVADGSLSTSNCVSLGSSGFGTRTAILDGNILIDCPLYGLIAVENETDPDDTSIELRNNTFRSSDGTMRGAQVSATLTASAAPTLISIGNRFDNLLVDSQVSYADGSGTHTGADDAAVLTDSASSWVVDGLIGCVVTNSTTSATATITDNDATTVTGTLSSDDWDTGDSYTIACANAKAWQQLDLDESNLTYTGTGAIRHYGKSNPALYISEAAASNRGLTLQNQSNLNSRIYHQNEADGGSAQLYVDAVPDATIGTGSSEIRIGSNVPTTTGDVKMTWHAPNSGGEVASIDQKTGDFATSGDVAPATATIATSATVAGDNVAVMTAANDTANEVARACGSTGYEICTTSTTGVLIDDDGNITLPATAYIESLGAGVPTYPAVSSQTIAQYLTTADGFVTYVPPDLHNTASYPQVLTQTAYGDPTDSATDNWYCYASSATEMACDFSNLAALTLPAGASLNTPTLLGGATIDSGTTTAVITISATTPISTNCDDNSELGHIHFRTDAQTDGCYLYVCEDDGAAGQQWTCVHD